MSLIMAYRGGNYQYWCSDGLTVSMVGSNPRINGEDTRKIFQLRNWPVLIGYSGDIYDADVIQRILEKSAREISVTGFLASVSNIVKSVNSISERYCVINNETRFETGLIVGGFLCQTDFLVIVTPKGKISPMKSFAAIGKDSSLFLDSARIRVNHNIAARSLFDRFQECFQLYWDHSPISKGPIFPVILDATRVVDLYEYSLGLYHSSCYEDYLNGIRRKMVSSFF